MSNEPIQRKGRELSMSELSNVHGGGRRRLSEREKDYLRKRWLGAQEGRSRDEDGEGGREGAQR